MLIGTKLSVPLMKTRMVPRPHLIHRLSEGKSSRLIVISGLAGSGKTSLACEWIRTDGLNAVWYALDKRDNEIDLFFRYFLTALGKIDRKLASVAEPLVGGQREITKDEVIPLVVDNLNDHIPDVHVVLDDYHLIENEEIQAWISDFLDYMPPALHLVLISRHATPASLSRLRVRGRLTEIVASDMGFTEEEAGRFFSEVIPVGLSTDQVRHLVRQTEGWVAGLQLFGLSCRGKDRVDDFDDIWGYIGRETADYLMYEVIRRQPERVRIFLRATSLLERFNAEVAGEITGLADAGETLKYVLRNDLFLNSLDTDQTWYRYHHLFSKAIREEVRRSESVLFKEVYRKAALWFAGRGYIEDAFRAAFASEDLEFITDLLEDYLHLWHEREEPSAALAWLERIPHDVFVKSPLLRLEECIHKIESFRLDEIEAVLRDMEGREEELFCIYQGQKRSYCADLYAYLTYALRYYYYSPAQTDIESLDRVVAMISPENKRFAGYIKILVARSYLLKGEPMQADVALKEAASALFSSRSLWSRILWFRAAAIVERARGRLSRSEAMLREGLQLVKRKGLLGTPLKDLLYLPMAWVHYHHNDLDNALKYAEDALKYAEPPSCPVGDVIEGNLLLCLIYRARNRPRDAARCLEKMERVSKEISAPETSVSVHPWVVRFTLQGGDIRYALQWSKERKLSLDEPFSYRLIDEVITQADLLYRLQSYEEVLEMLNRFRPLCVEQDMMEAVLQIDLFLCAAHYSLGHNDQAGRICEKALAWAETEGYVRPFADFAPIISPVVAALVGTHERWRMRPCVAAALADSSAGQSKECCPAANETRTGVDLTDREAEILRLMAADYQYKEIAHKACISLETVRTHAKHILAKLDSASRRQAIRKAREMGLLQDR